MITKLGPGELTLTTGEDKAQVAKITSKVTYDPGYSIGADEEMLDGSFVAGEEENNPKLEIEALQDYEQSSLISYLYNHRGKEASFVFVPSKAGKLKLAGKVRIIPPAIGGDVGKKNKLSISLPGVGPAVLTEDYTPADS